MRLNSSFRIQNNESLYDGEISVQTSGEEVVYHVIQLEDVRCAEGYLEFPHNNTCIAVAECGDGFFRTSDEFGRNWCLPCEEGCRKC